MFATLIAACAIGCGPVPTVRLTFAPAAIVAARSWIRHHPYRGPVPTVRCKP
jgi:hypothetical protein